ncbi:hypothetical protein AGMMS49940_07380 [Spirochaetia bacterium]|nr:hypothetical protein AGMMS49940_07380 [Spirochaetia bacterium]
MVTQVHGGENGVRLHLCACMRNFCLVFILSLSCSWFIFAEGSTVHVVGDLSKNNRWIAKISLNNTHDGGNTPFSAMSAGSSLGEAEFENVPNGVNTISVWVTRDGKNTDFKSISIVTNYESVQIMLSVSNSGKIKYLEKSVSTSYLDLAKKQFDDGKYSMVVYMYKNTIGDIDLRSSNGDTALIQLAKKPNIPFDGIKAFVEAGAKVNLRNEAGETAASIAYDKGEIEVYNYLKEHGAVDFEPKQVVTSGSSSSTTNVYTESSSSSNSSSSQSSTAQRIATDLNRAAASMHTVTVYYMDNGTRKSISSIKSASSKAEAERAAEREWKSLNGFNNKLTFLEAVAVN